MRQIDRLYSKKSLYTNSSSIVGILSSVFPQGSAFEIDMPNQQNVKKSSEKPKVKKKSKTRSKKPTKTKSEFCPVSKKKKLVKWKSEGDLPNKINKKQKAVKIQKSKATPATKSTKKTTGTNPSKIFWKTVKKVPEKQKIRLLKTIVKVHPTPPKILNANEKLLSTVQLTPPTALTYSYYGSLKTEYKEELSFFNPTENIVAFKVKCTSPKIIKVMPCMGYLKPVGKVTLWVIVKPKRREKPPVNERLSIVLCRVADNNLPPNPILFWKKDDKPKSTFRRVVKLVFQESSTPPKPTVKKSARNWVDRIKKIQDQDASKCGSSSKSSSSDDDDD